MTREQKIQYLSVALRVAGVSFNEHGADLVLTLVERITETKGKLGVDEIIKIDHDLKEQYAYLYEKNEEPTADDPSTHPEG